MDMKAFKIIYISVFFLFSKMYALLIFGLTKRPWEAVKMKDTSEFCKLNKSTNSDYFQLSDRLYQGSDCHQFTYKYGDANEYYIDDGEDPSGDAIKDGDCESAQYLKDRKRTNITLGKYVCSNAGIQEPNLKQTSVNNTLSSNDKDFSKVRSGVTNFKEDQTKSREGINHLNEVKGSGKEKGTELIKGVDSIISFLVSCLTTTSRNLEPSMRRVRNIILNESLSSSSSNSDIENHVNRVHLCLEVPLDMESNAAPTSRIPVQAIPDTIINNIHRSKKNTSTRLDLSPLYRQLLFNLPKTISRVGETNTSQFHRIFVIPKDLDEVSLKESNLEQLLCSISNSEGQMNKHLQLPLNEIKENSSLFPFTGKVSGKGEENAYIPTLNQKERNSCEFSKPLFVSQNNLQKLKNEYMHCNAQQNILSSLNEDQCLVQLGRGGHRNKEINSDISGRSNENLISKEGTINEGSTSESKNNEVINFEQFKEKANRNSTIIRDLVKDLIAIGTSKDFPVYLEHRKTDPKPEVDSEPVRLLSKGNTPSLISKCKRKRKLRRIRKFSKKH